MDTRDVTKFLHKDPS